jgi:MoaA/NifB/PqqE/SkfB family radical SAM enzyme
VNILSPFFDLCRGRAPGQLIIQLTDRCNGLCPQCGMRASLKYPRSRLEVDRVKRIIDAAAARGIAILSFTGGEPLLMLRDLVELIRYAGTMGIEYIRTGTNGFLFSRPENPHFEERIARLADTLAATRLRNFWISLDSADPATHEAMRGFPGVVAGIAKALPYFHERGLYPSANLGLNRNLAGPLSGSPCLSDQEGGAASAAAFYNYYRSAFRRFFRLAEDLGFTMASCCYPIASQEKGSRQPGRAVYGAHSSDAVISFNPAEKALLFKALSETIPEFRERLRIFTPRSALHLLIGELLGESYRSYPCRGGREFFFVGCQTGEVFPCGYRGAEALGRGWENWSESATASECRQCEWECFRDPSILFGPLLELFRSPGRLIHRMTSDWTLFRLWWEDLRYFRETGFFDGRLSPKEKNIDPAVGPVEKKGDIPAAPEIDAAIPPFPCQR